MFPDDFISGLISKHRENGVLIDANLLLLLLVGTFDRGLIERIKRLNKYSVRDFDLLQHFCALFPRILTTPHVLTEVSNLIQNSNDRRILAFFQFLAEHCASLIERYQISADIVQHSLFLSFGLADSALAMESDQGMLLLTDDFALCAALQKSGRDAINFTHLRVGYLLL
jgi:hypothetical protein